MAQTTTVDWLEDLARWFERHAERSQQNHAPKVQVEMSYEIVRSIVTTLNEIVMITENAPIKAPNVNPNCLHPARHAPRCDCGSL